MKRISFLMALFLSVAINAMASHRHTQTFKTGWKFTRVDDSAASQVDYDDSRWQTVTVPLRSRSKCAIGFPTILLLPIITQRFPSTSML